MHREKPSFYDADFLSRLERLHLIGKHLARGSSAGQRRSRRLGDGLEFADHRDYAPGDDPRFLDWHYYARMERLLLRLFHEHSQADVAILLDCSASMAPAGQQQKFNYARMAAAALAYLAMGDLDNVILCPMAAGLAKSMRTGRNRATMPAVLEFLSGLQAEGKTDLLQCSQRFARQYPAAGTVLLISDLLDSAQVLGEALGWLRPAQRDVIVLHVYAPQDARPQLSGPVVLEAAETHERRTMAISPKLLEAYARTWGRFTESCRRTCLACGATYVSAPTDVPFDRLILQTLRRAGLLVE